MAPEASHSEKTVRTVRQYDIFITKASHPDYGTQAFLVFNAQTRYVNVGGSDTDIEIDVAYVSISPNGTIRELHIPPDTVYWSSFVDHVDSMESVAEDLPSFLMYISGFNTLFKETTVDIIIERTHGLLGPMYPGP